MLPRALAASIAVGLAAWLSLPCATAHAAVAQHGAVATASAGRVDVFTVGADDAVWQKTHSAGWGTWTSIGGNVTSRPDAVAWPDGRIDVVALGADGHAWMRTYSGGRWGAWMDVGGPISSEVSVTRVGGSRIDLFAHSGDGQPITRSFRLGAGWTAWAPHDGDPDVESVERLVRADATEWGRGEPPHAAAVDADGGVWISSATDLGWSAWEPLGAPAPVYSTVYWYGDGGSRCLQTGFPATDSQLCSGDVQMLAGAVGADIAVTATGRYCSHYNLTSVYCHAEGNEWSFGVVGSAANNYCNPPHAPCGMHEYVSFAGRGARNRPWGAAFASNPGPSLVVSGRADPQRADVSGGAWGYLCPILQDVTTGSLIEYCLEQWRIGLGYPRIPAFDVVSACASASGYNVDQVITRFGPGTRFASQRPGTGTSYLLAAGTDPEPMTFAASISPTELLRAVDAVNAQCGRMLSRDPADYALFGVEHGVEGGNLTSLESDTSDLALFSARE